MTEEYYAIEMNYYGETVYLKNLYSYTVGGKLRLYFTFKKNVLDAKRYKTARYAQKVVDKITSWIVTEAKSNEISAKPLKVEATIDIKTTEL